MSNPHSKTPGGSGASAKMQKQMAESMYFSRSCACAASSSPYLERISLSGLCSYLTRLFSATCGTKGCTRRPQHSSIVLRTIPVHP